MVIFVHANLSTKFGCNLKNGFLVQVYTNLRQNTPIVSRNILIFELKENE